LNQEPPTLPKYTGLSRLISKKGRLSMYDPPKAKELTPERIKELEAILENSKAHGFRGTPLELITIEFAHLCIGMSTQLDNKQKIERVWEALSFAQYKESTIPELSEKELENIKAQWETLYEGDIK
jgi:hypothetical protein